MNRLVDWRDSTRSFYLLLARNVAVLACLLALAWTAPTASAQQFCPGCLRVPEAFDDGGFPGATISWEPDVGVDFDGLCLRVEGSCPMLLPCEFSWRLTITVLNPVPGAHLPPIELTVMEVTVSLDWSVLTSFQGTAIVESTNGAVPCGEGFEGGFTWLGNWLGTLRESCTKC